MREVETDWWYIALPDEWQSELDEESILIFDEDELGCISLTTLVAEDGQAANESSLRRLIESIGYNPETAQTCRIAEDWQGWEFETVEEGDYIREWFLIGGGHTLLISYSCAEEDRAMDISVVEQILDSLRLKEKGD